MKVLRLGVVACATAFALGCGGGGSNGSGSAGSGGGSTGTAGATGAAGTTGSGGSSTGTGGSGTGGSATGTAGTTGTGGTTGVAGTTGTGGSATGAAGTTGGGGISGAGGGTGGGRGGAGGAAGGAGRGGTTGSAGSGGAAGSAGTGGAAGSGGSGGTPHGSAAKNICPQGQTYGNPLTGMGTIQSITPTNPDYFAFIEGPIWIAGLGTVFFSDNATSPERIWKVVPPSTMPTQFVMNSGSNGLAVDNSDRIVAADQRNKRIATFDPMTGQIVGTPISTGSAKPNDVIVRSDNNIYFTDPATGFYRIAPGSTTPSAVMKLPNNGGQPNGIELSLDENTLIVGDVAQQKIFKFTLAADGTVMTSTGAELVSQTMRTTVDGMCTDCAGNIYAGTQGAIEVYSSTGSYIGSIVTNLQTSNCTFGGADRKTLYMTTPAALKSVTLAVPGLPD